MESSTRRRESSIVDASPFAAEEPAEEPDRARQIAHRNRRIPATGAAAARPPGTKPRKKKRATGGVTHPALTPGRVAAAPAV